VPLPSKPALLLAILCCLPAETTIAAPIPFDLDTWSTVGSPGNGNWIVEGNTALQTANGGPTLFAGPDEQFDVTIVGSLRVEHRYDDDYVGLLFGYRGDGDFLVLDWKQADQNTPHGVAREGFTLARMQGPLGDLPFGPPAPAATGYDVWATDHGPTRGWEDHTTYEFELVYGPDRLAFDIRGGTGDFACGLTIFDLAPGDVGLDSFQSGRFGFFNFSQANTRYEASLESPAPLPAASFSDGTLAHMPEPGSLSLLALGALGLAYGTRRRQPVARQVVGQAAGGCGDE
jgi:hypothetical protein